jgi:hypothetical protein
MKTRPERRGRGSKGQTQKFRAVRRRGDDPDPAGDRDLRQFVGVRNAAFLRWPNERRVWRGTERALNGGGYHLLRYVRGESFHWPIVQLEYRRFCANRLQRGPLPTFVVVSERALLQLVNSRKPVSQVVESRSGFAARSNWDARQTADTLRLEELRSASGDVR